MAERLVRFRTPFFDDLDRQLPAERHVSGAPSATDFLLYELPTIRDLLAADFEAITTAVGGRDPLRLYLGTGTLVRAVALYCVRAADDHIDVVGLELDLERPHRSRLHTRALHSPIRPSPESHTTPCPRNRVNIKHK